MFQDKESRYVATHPETLLQLEEDALILTGDELLSKHFDHNNPGNNDCIYRISRNSFCGNYSFLRLKYVDIFIHFLQ